MRLNRVSGSLLLPVALVVLVAFGCATRLSRPEVPQESVEAERRAQSKLALSLLLERQTRVWGLGLRVRVAGAELCGSDVRYAFGFFALDRQTFSDSYQEVASDLGIEPGVRIWELMPGFGGTGPALEPGDRIFSIDDRPVTDLSSFEKTMQKPFSTGRLSIKLIRASGEEIDAFLEGVRSCDYRVAVAENDAVNAYADGKNVILATGMVRFVDSDDEMALVVGHELAHNALGHLRQKRAQTFAGVLVDLAIAIFGGVDTGGVFTQLGGIVFSEEMEKDADYMGLYFAARAGYEISVAPDFWRRMAVEHPATIKDNMLATHPSSPERSVALRQVVAEIERKRAEERPLRPEFERPVRQ